MRQEIPDGLSYDDRLSLMLGRLARSDGRVNFVLSNIWRYLVWEGPAWRLAPDVVPVLVEQCITLVAYDDRCAGDRAVWASAALREAKEATRERNAYLHDLWMSGTADGEFVRQSNKRKHGVSPEAIVHTLDDLDRLLEKFARVEIRLTELLFLLWPIDDGETYPSTWGGVRGEFDLNADGSFDRRSSA